MKETGFFASATPESIRILKVFLWKGFIVNNVRPKYESLYFTLQEIRGFAISEKGNFVWLTLQMNERMGMAFLQGALFAHANAPGFVFSGSVSCYLF